MANPQLPDRASADVAQLLRRFENILAFESVRIVLLPLMCVCVCWSKQTKRTLEGVRRVE